jgi:WD40 repeat protein
MTYVAKISNGAVEIYDINGNYQGMVSGSSDAATADIGPNDDVVVTKIDGTVITCDINGSYQRRITGDATNARWAGSEIAVTKKDGSVEIYDINGNYQRRI